MAADAEGDDERCPPDRGAKWRRAGKAHGCFQRQRRNSPEVGPGRPTAEVWKAGGSASAPMAAFISPMEGTAEDREEDFTALTGRLGRTEQGHQHVMSLFGAVGFNPLIFCCANVLFRPSSGLYFPPSPITSCSGCLVARAIMSRETGEALISIQSSPARAHLSLIITLSLHHQTQR